MAAVAITVIHVLLKCPPADFPFPYVMFSSVYIPLSVAPILLRCCLRRLVRRHLLPFDAAYPGLAQPTTVGHLQSQPHISHHWLPNELPPPLRFERDIFFRSENSSEGRGASG